MEFLHYVCAALVIAGVTVGLPWLIAEGLRRMCGVAPQDGGRKEG